MQQFREGAGRGEMEPDAPNTGLNDGTKPSTMLRSVLTLGLATSESPRSLPGQDDKHTPAVYSSNLNPLAAEAMKGQSIHVQHFNSPIESSGTCRSH